VHENNQTPSAAIIAVGVSTGLTILLGEALLVPILEVGAVTAAVGWMAASAAYYKMKPRGVRFAAAAFGLSVTAIMVLVKLLPWVPGHFTWHEWLALAIWGVVGTAIYSTRKRYLLPENSVEMANAET